MLLPDSTKIWVNSGTILRFPQKFKCNQREIYVEGEIFLNVKKNLSRPFIVRTSQMDIKVLGTSFSVSTYPKEDKQTVVLKEGLINVNDKEGDFICSTKLSESSDMTKYCEIYCYSVI